MSDIRGQRSDASDQKSKIIRHSRASGNPVLIIIAIFLLLFSTNANADQVQRTEIAPDGETIISGQFGHDNVKIIITTHIVDIGKASDPEPPDDQKISSCPYSRIPCSPVDHLRIFVNKKELFVPRSVYMDLADLGVGSLKTSGKQILLEFDGGDAAASYGLEISFNVDHILTRKRFSNEFPDSFWEKTVYHGDVNSEN